jgi:5'-nucleotidase / UDP-sugar diphosphatase
MSHPIVSRRRGSVRRPAVWVLTGALLALVASVQPALAHVETLTILHVNDSHSCLTAYGPKDADGQPTLGGIARIATLVARARATEPNVLFTHGGDFFVGDFMFQKYLGVPELQILKSLGMDALALGNHEFDLYPSTLEDVLSTAGWPGEGFPILCANLDTSGDPAIDNFVHPYTIKQVGNLKIGILGLTTESTNQESNPSPLVILPPLDVAQGWVDKLRNDERCDLVIVISHLGADVDRILASSVSGIDVILGGHSHTEIPVPVRVGRTLIVQAGEFYGHISRLQLRIVGGRIHGWDYRLVPVDSRVAPAPEVQALVDNLVAGVEADPRFGPVYTQTLGRVAVDVEKPLGTGLCMDNSLGNLIADSYREAAGSDLAFHPQGFSNQTIWAGPLTGNDVLRAVPYGFDPATGLGMKLATFRATGLSILSGLEFALYYLPNVDTFFLHLSGMSFACDLSRPPGQRVDYASVRVNGVPIDPAGNYTVAVPDGVVPFLGQIPGFEIEDLQVTSRPVYTVIRDYLVAHSPVARYAEGRVLDTAPLSPAFDGVDALAATVRLFQTNGSIDSRRSAESLLAILRDVQIRLGDRHGRHYGHHNDEAALRALDCFESNVRRQFEARHLTPVAADRLTYLAEALRCVIRPVSPASHSAGPNPQEAAVVDVAGSEPPLALSAQSPFRGQTTISYRAADGMPVRLAVVDVNGRMVRDLADEPAGTGTRSIQWDARNDRGERLPAGKYFLLLQAGGRRQTQGVVLVK